MTDPEVTIITPTYNHEKYIQKCINSVQSQTFQKWEQIIIDDASTDRTLSIAYSNSINDKRIKVITHKKRWGINKLAQTYNGALKIAKGKYIAILEGDDFWPNNKLSLQINYMEMFNPILSYGNCIVTNYKGTPIKLIYYKAQQQDLDNTPPGKILSLFSNLKFSIIPVTVVIQKKILVKIGGFQKSTFYPFVDIPTFLKLTIQGNFGYINDILGYYRKQKESSWFLYASNTPSMGKEELQNCVNEFLKNNSKNQVIKKMWNEALNIRKEQATTIVRKKITKQFSLLVNNLAFRGCVSPFYLIFLSELVIYKIRKKLK